MGTAFLQATTPKHEHRAAWVATVYRLDWPTSYGTTTTVANKQKTEADAFINSLATNTAKTWSGSTGTPDMDLRAAIKASRESMGLQPNRALYGGGAWDARLALLEKQNTAGAFAGLMRLESELARYARLREIRVNDLVYSVGSGKQEIVTDNKVYVFSAYNEISTRDASNVKRFWSPVMGGGEWAVYVDETAAEIIKLTVHHKNKIVSPNTLGVRTLTIS